MGRKKKAEVVEEVVVEAPVEEVVEETPEQPTEEVETVEETPVAEVTEETQGETSEETEDDATATAVMPNDKAIPDVVYSKLNLINVASIKSVLNAGLSENTIVRCLDTNDMYAPTFFGTVSQTVEQLDADGILMKIAAA